MSPTILLVALSVLTEKPGAVTQAVVTVDAPPAEVYALVTSYASWPAVLTDVSQVKVESGGREKARVTFHSQAIGYDVTLEFDNVPGEVIRFRGIKGPPGGRANGEYVLQPIDGGKRTRVVAKLYLDVVGAPGWFVSGSRVRTMRRNKLQRDLDDVAKHFAQQKVGSIAP
jgi:hypothetical protein